MRTLITTTLLLLLAGCASQYSGESPQLNKATTLYIMPFANQSNMPMAQAQAEQLIASAFAEEGVKVKVYPKAQIGDLQASLEPKQRQKEAQTWLALQPAGYVLNGSVQEWQYKYGLDGEPAVGLTLVLANSTGEELWRGSAAQSGWGRESLSNIALDAIEDLLDQLDWE